MDFGSYLRTAREGRHLTLDAVSDRTKIRRELLADLENNYLSRWPKPRIYRLGYVRSYAQVVGLDPADVLTRFDDEFPDQHPVAFHQPMKAKRKAPRFALPQPGIVVGSLALVVVAALGVWTARSVQDFSFQTPDSRPEAGSRKSEAQSAQSAGVLQPLVVAPDLSTSEDAELPRAEVVAAEVVPAEIEGELRIVSDPPQAHVTVNGIGRGQTPLRVRYLPLGSYTIRIVHPGYRIRETHITLKPEQPNRTVRVALRDRSAVARVSYPSISE